MLHEKSRDLLEANVINKKQAFDFDYPEEDRSCSLLFVLSASKCFNINLLFNEASLNRMRSRSSINDSHVISSSYIQVP